MERLAVAEENALRFAEQEKRRAAKKAEDAATLRMKAEEIREKVAAGDERLALRKLQQVRMARVQLELDLSPILA